MKKRNTFLILTALVSIVSRAYSSDLGTAFTYQGRLIKSGSPVGSPTAVSCNFTFGLWDAAAAGNQVGTSPLGPTAISVASGLFTTNLDFGPNAINGQARWLEITVQCPGDMNATMLTPRVELKPAPHAMALPGFYTQENATSPNIVGGYHGNVIDEGVVAGTITGGGSSSNPQVVHELRCTIGGGSRNTAGTPGGTIGGATIAGGYQNVAAGAASAIGGGGLYYLGAPTAACVGGERNNFGCRFCVGGTMPGYPCDTASHCPGGTCQEDETYCTGGTCDSSVPHTGNSAMDSYTAIAGGTDNWAGSGIGTLQLSHGATVGGGGGNRSFGNFSTVGGGEFNTAFGPFSAVPGGFRNIAGGNYSLASGHQAVVRTPDQVGGGDIDGDQGTFVWADSTNADFQSTGPDQYLIRANGGVGINTNAPSNETALHIQAAADNFGVLVDSLSAPGSEIGLHSGGAGYASLAKNAYFNGGWLRFENGMGALIQEIEPDGDVPFYVAGPGAGFIPTTSPALILKASGDVGINTNAPDAPLHIVGGTNATLSNGTGYLVMGSVSGNNVVLDNNEIQARDNGLAGDLFLNNDGGFIGVARSNTSHPIHVGTGSTNGNGAHLTAGGTWTNGSDRNSKENFKSIDSHSVLEKLAALPITDWNYIGESDGVHHIGPMAQDFRAAFGLGHDERYITTIDSEGIALAAIQGLNQIVQERECQIIALQEEVANLKATQAELAELKILVNALVSKMEGAK